jgi:hypothetical protein
VIREITERKHQLHRLTYLATRDELTGHLNRNSLRAELAEAIATAQSQERHCGFLVASIDRLAIINDSYGFDAADEVIVGGGRAPVAFAALHRRDRAHRRQQIRRHPQELHRDRHSPRGRRPPPGRRARRSGRHPRRARCR